MTTIRNGYIVCSRATTKSRGRWSQRQRVYKDWFRATAIGEYGQQIRLGSLIIPNEYSGKKLRFKVEVMKEELE